MSTLFHWVTSCDVAEMWQLSTQDPATPVMKGIVTFHNYLNFYVVVIGIAICWLLFIVVLDFSVVANKTPMKFHHHSLLEIIWTIIPALVLVLIAIPSFSLLYSLDDFVDPSLTIKIVGHQWYWSYEFSDSQFLDTAHSTFKYPRTAWDRPETLSFDSYILEDSSLNRNQPFRLLEVDNCLVVPIKTHIRLLVTSADVLHSWAVPSFGLKIDACPGRLSQGSLFIKREGVFYGQCSEICGVNYGFMPIKVRTAHPVTFARYLGAHMSRNVHGCK